MFRKIAVGDVMTRNFAFVNPLTSLHQCSKEMVKNRVNSLLITEGTKLKGILTARDILWILTKKSGLNLKNFKAIDVATRKVAVIKPSADIGQAIHKMKRYGFRKLPVLSRGEVVGILTIKDVLRVDPSVYGELGVLRDVKEEEIKLEKLSVKDIWETEGICEDCDSFASLLKIDGRALCPNCRDERY